MHINRNLNMNIYVNKYNTNICCTVHDIRELVATFLPSRSTPNNFFGIPDTASRVMLRPSRHWPNDAVTRTMTQVIRRGCLPYS